MYGSFGPSSNVSAIFFCLKSPCQYDGRRGAAWARSGMRSPRMLTPKSLRERLTIRNEMIPNKSSSRFQAAEDGNKNAVDERQSKRRNKRPGDDGAHRRIPKRVNGV